MINSGLGGGCLFRACSLEASSSGDKVAVGLDVILDAPVAVGVPVALALLLALGVAVAALVCVVATAALPSALLEAFCSWLSLHPLSPQQTSNVKAKAVCKWRLVGGVFIVFPRDLSALIHLITSGNKPLSKNLK